jgi:hypothetical protein
VELLFELPGNLPGLGEASSLFLREDEIVAESDLEAPAGALDQLRLEAELLPDFVRQTGGSGEVVSDGAVLDGEMSRHGRPLLGGPCP